MNQNARLVLVNAHSNGEGSKLELDSLKYYSPDTYCHLEPDIKSLSYDQMKNVMKFCFAQHEKWVRLSI